VQKFGPEQAAKLWIGPTANAKDYWLHIEAWLGFIKQVRGDDDPVLSKLCEQAADVNPNTLEWTMRHAEMVREFDLFLSHASADKPRIRKLKDKPEGAGIRVFFDENSIAWGDSIVQRINHGLLKSTFFCSIPYRYLCFDRLDK
jgi:hypothetical protein